MALNLHAILIKMSIPDREFSSTPVVGGWTIWCKMSIHHLHVYTHDNLI